MKKSKSKSKKRTEISIIIPAYREEDIIADTLVRVKKVLDTISNNFEIICVVDGFVDDTYKNSLIISKKYPKIIKTLGYRKNRGKGFAIRLGFAKAKGEIVGFIDADGQIEPKSLAVAVKNMKKENAEIVIGSKKHPQSNVSYSPLRKVLSFLSQKFIRALFQINVSDTQAGLKIFKKSLIDKLLPRLRVDRFAIDIEILSVSSYLGYKRIIEIPIVVANPDMEKTSVNENVSIMDILETLKAALTIFYNLRFTGFYSEPNKNFSYKKSLPKLFES